MPLLSRRPLHHLVVLHHLLHWRSRETGSEDSDCDAAALYGCLL
jgi:hypothetical protein